MDFLPIHALSSRAADFVRTYHHVKAPLGLVISDLVRPSFWSHHAAKLQIGDLIDVVAEDNTFDVTLRVVSKGAAGAVMVRPIRVWREGDEAMIESVAPVARKAPAIFMQPKVETPSVPEEDDVPGFKISFAPSQRWRVVRRSDGNMVHKGAQSKDEAIAWARAHLSEIAA